MKRLLIFLGMCVFFAMTAFAVPTAADVTDSEIQSPAILSAEKIVESGTCGDNLTWTLDSEGTLTISGEGEMEERVRTPWQNVRSSIKYVVIEKGVTSISAKAFQSCSNLVKVTISESVVSIGKSVFDYSRNIEEIRVHEKNIAFSSDEKGVLFDKNKTTLIKYPTGSTDLFYSIPDSVIDIGDAAFKHCEFIVSVEMNDGVAIIGKDAFSLCTSLASITLPNSVTHIGKNAFYDCESLVKITIPASVISIGSPIFTFCEKLTSITVDKNNKYYSNDDSGVLFNKDKTVLIQYPARRQSDSYSIPDSVKVIEDKAFIRCGRLKNVNIPNGVTEIGEKAFEECYDLTQIHIPESVISIGKEAFSFCTFSLEKITVDENNACYSSDERGVLFNKDKTVLVQYPCGNESISYTIPDSVVNIGEQALGYCKFETITLGKSIKVIEDDAFISCEMLKKIVIPNGVTEIGDSAFSFCDSLTRIDIPASVTMIEEDAFYKCEYVTIYGYSGSTAEEYANENNIPFKALAGYENVRGELNSDGVIDMNDAILLLQHSMFPELYPLEYAGNVDFTGDGVVDMNDAILLLQHSMFPELYPIA